MHDDEKEPKFKSSDISLTTLKVLLLLLDDILENGPLIYPRGLCNQPMKLTYESYYKSRVVVEAKEIFGVEEFSGLALSMLAHDLETALSVLVEEWADVHGRNREFPVENSMELFAYNSRKWRKDTEHGKLRWALTKEVRQAVSVLIWKIENGEVENEQN